jgi:hypothetical protein
MDPEEAAALRDRDVHVRNRVSARVAHDAEDATRRREADHDEVLDARDHVETRAAEARELDPAREIRLDPRLDAARSGRHAGQLEVAIGVSAHERLAARHQREAARRTVRGLDAAAHAGAAPASRSQPTPPAVAADVAPLACACRRRRRDEIPAADRHVLGAVVAARIGGATATMSSKPRSVN